MWDSFPRRRKCGTFNTSRQGSYLADIKKKSTIVRASFTADRPELNPNSWYEAQKSTEAKNKEGHESVPVSKYCPQKRL